MTTKRREPRLDLNPSSADRWTTCTASPRFIMESWDKVPASSDTVYNQEGTTAHEVAAAALENRLPRLSDPYFCPVPADGEMYWHAFNYAEYVDSLRKPGSKVLVEQKLPLWYMKERNCIIDAAVINPDSLHVVDYKYGEGVPVSPVENLQAAIYGVVIGSMGQPLPTDFPVFIHIYQPRGRAAEDGAPHVWETTWLDLCNLTRKVTEVAEDIQAEIPYGLAMFAPSEKACQWCPAKGFCTARQAALADGFEVLDDQPRPLPPAGVLTETQLVRILNHKKQMVSWLDDVEEWAQEFMRNGGKIPGFKLVASRGGNRYWADPKKAEAELLSHTVLKREEIIEESMVSPAQIEEKIGKARFRTFANLTAKNPGAPVIAPEGDKRPALEDAASDFTPIE